MDDPRFDYFQIVPLDGHSSLEALPANVFGGKTFHWLWIGQTDIATVDPSAFAGEAIQKSLSLFSLRYIHKYITLPFIFLYRVLRETRAAKSQESG